MVSQLAVRHMRNRLARAYFKAFPKPAFLAAHTWPELVLEGRSTTVCLSFDCDTEEDTGALPRLLDLLDQFEMPAAFALIGELVEADPVVHRQLVARGHEIVNHGYMRHTQRRPDGSFYSSRFYHKLSIEDIQADIQQNHDLLQNLLDTTVRGFRTPHFSTFQQPHQRAQLYQILSDLDYTYSSSTTAVHLKTAGQSCRGPLWELPLTGCWDDLRSPFDSWGLIAAPDRRYVDDDFARLFHFMLQAALQSPHPIFLNIYVDPAHVVSFPGFLQMLKHIHEARNHLHIARYTDLIDHLERPTECAASSAS